MKFAYAIEADNFTALYKQLHSDILKDGLPTLPRGMPTLELNNVSLILTNPRNRLLYSNVRKHNYTYGSAEFLWYLIGTNKLSFIEFYLPRMKDFSDDGETVNSAYGYRIFGGHADFPNQWRNVQYKLLSDPDTRQAVITIHYQKDLVNPTKDVPCTLNLHFLVRENKLNMFVQMRSNDSFMGLIYDVFSFTLLQEHMFNFLKCDDRFKDLELGTYVHRSDSMHFYERDYKKLTDVLNEKFSATGDHEPHMSYLTLPSEELTSLIIAEGDLRHSGKLIDVGNYTGICSFIAEKLNKILLKK